jgi:hypothetical protein
MLAFYVRCTSSNGLKLTVSQRVDVEAVHHSNLQGLSRADHSTIDAENFDTEHLPLM